jgi:hypothetical protein
VRSPAGFVLVLVVVLDGGGLLQCVIVQGLEGSRFGAYLASLAIFVSALVQPERVHAGGSRNDSSRPGFYNESEGVGVNL